jgi:hypothetical protein
MRRIALAVLVVAACRTKSTTSEGPAPSVTVASAPAPSASVAVDAAIARTAPPPTMVVEQWNVAHIKHDLKALEGLYAAHVQFYGQRLSNKQCVSAKKAAFEKSPDYSQTIRDLHAKSDGTVTFTKTSTIKGKSTDYPAILVVANGVITAETDKVTDANLAAAAAKAASWCLEDYWSPNDKVIAPYKVSAMQACTRGMQTKFFKEIVPPGKFYDMCGQISCPTKCDQGKRECGYDLRIEDHSPDRQSMSSLVSWVYVDAVDGTLFWEGAKGWESEPLPK